MATTALARLEPLDFIAPDAVPRDRRKAEKNRRDARAVAGLDVIQFFLMTVLLGSFVLMFGLLTIIGTLKMAPVVPLLLALGGAGGSAAGMLYVKSRLSDSLRLFRASAPSERLHLEAETEQALHDTAFQLNGCVAAWNSAASVAGQADIDERFRAGLIASRERIAAALCGFDERLKRFRLAVIPKPKALPTGDWKMKVRIEGSWINME